MKVFENLIWILSRYETLEMTSGNEIMSPIALHQLQPIAAVTRITQFLAKLTKKRSTAGKCLVSSTAAVVTTKKHHVAFLLPAPKVSNGKCMVSTNSIYKYNTSLI